MRRNEVATDITARDQTGRAFSSFQSNLATAEKRVERFGGQFRAVAAAASTFGVAAGAVAVRTANSAREIERLSQVSNASPEQFQRMAVAAETVGIQQEKLSDILKDTTDRVGDFLTTGGGPMADFFETIGPKVGVTADQFARLSGPEALQLYVSSLEKAGASQAEMTFYMEAIASDATLLLPLLRDNGEEMGRLGDRAAALGGIMDAQTIASLSRTRTAISEMSTAMTGASNIVVGAMAPAMERFTTATVAAMQEGTLFRRVVEGFAANFDKIAIAVSATAGVMAGRYVIALGAAKVATFQLTAATLGLRTALLKSGLGAVAVLAGTAAAAYISMRDEGTDPAREAQDALNTALGDFYTSRAPGAAQSAIDLANDNYKLAASALAAADAEVAKRRAQLDGASGREKKGASMQLAAAKDELAAAEDAVAQARKRMEHAVRTVAGSASEEMTRMQGAAHDVTVTFDGLGESVSNMSVNATGALAEMPEVLQGIETAGTSAFESIGREVRSAFRDVENLSQGFGNLARRLADMALDSAINGLFSALGNTETGRSIGGIFSSAFGGARANGGPVTAGRTYLVGERGPELFTPSSSGGIIPNHTMSPTPAPVVNIINPPSQPTVTQGPNGRIDVAFDAQIAASLRSGPQTRRALAQGYGLTGAG